MTDHIAETMRMFNDLSWNLVNAPKDEIENTNKLCILITYMLDNFELGDVTNEYLREIFIQCNVLTYNYLNSIKQGAIPFAVIRYIFNRDKGLDCSFRVIRLESFNKFVDRYSTFFCESQE